MDGGEVFGFLNVIFFLCVCVGGENVKFRLILTDGSLRIYLFGRYHLLGNKIIPT